MLEKIIDDPERFAVPELFAFEVYSVSQRIHPDGLEVFRTGVIPLLQGGIYANPWLKEFLGKQTFLSIWVERGWCLLCHPCDFNGI